MADNPNQRSEDRDSDRNRGKIAPMDGIDVGSAESFPVSDPPAWTPLEARPPRLADDIESKPALRRHQARWHTAPAETLVDTGAVMAVILAICSLGVVMYMGLFYWLFLRIP